jgi:hypothetical protein
MRSCTSFGAGEPFGPTTLVRLIEPKGAPAYDAPPFDEAFLGRRIVGWQEAPDYPTYQELETFGVRLAGGPEIGGEFFCALTQDKLMGWPNWAQSPSYAKCPKCGTAQRPLVLDRLRGQRPVHVRRRRHGLGMAMPRATRCSHPFYYTY